MRGLARIARADPLERSCELTAIYLLPGPTASYRLRTIDSSFNVQLRSSARNLLICEGRTFSTNSAKLRARCGRDGRARSAGASVRWASPCKKTGKVRRELRAGFDRHSAR